MTHKNSDLSVKDLLYWLAKKTFFIYKRLSVNLFADCKKILTLGLKVISL
jgi:hypothetical protein